MPVVLASNACGALAVDATHLYWGTGNGTAGNAMVYSVPITGGSPALLTTVTTNGQQPYALAVGGTSLYFTDRWSQVWTLPAAGGVGSVLVTTAANQSMGQQTAAIVADANNVYFTTWAQGSVLEIPRSGGTLITLTSGLTYATPNTNPYNIAISGGYVYWTNPGGGQSGVDHAGTVQRAPIGGGTVQTLASGQAFPYGLAVDATSVYWIDLGTLANSFNDGAVMKAPIGGGQVTALIPGPLQLSGTIASDATNVYFVFAGGTLGRAPIATGAPAPTSIAGSANNPVTNFLVDATNLYYCEGNPPSIYKFGK